MEAEAGSPRGIVQQNEELHICQVTRQAFEANHRHARVPAQNRHVAISQGFVWTAMRCRKHRDHYLRWNGRGTWERRRTCDIRDANSEGDNSNQYRPLHLHYDTQWLDARGADTVALIAKTATVWHRATYRLSRFRLRPLSLPGRPLPAWDCRVPQQRCDIFQARDLAAQIDHWNLLACPAAILKRPPRQRCAQRISFGRPPRFLEWRRCCR